MKITNPTSFISMVCYCFYLLQGKVMFSQVSVILSTIGLMDIRSLLILVKAWSVRILLECFLLVLRFFKSKIYEVHLWGAVNKTNGT